MTITRVSQMLGLSIVLASTSGSRVEAQTERAECASVSARLRLGRATAVEVQSLGSCVRSGPSALADAWKRPSGRSEEQASALVEATAMLRDDQLFSTAVDVAVATGNASLDRVRALQVLARYYDERLAPSLDFLTKTELGSPVPRRFDTFSVAGATPLRASARSEIGQVLARLSTSDPDPVVLGAARRLRQSMANSDPANMPLAPGAIALIADCDSRVTLQSKADIGVQVQLRVEGASPFAHSYWIAGGDAGRPTKRRLRLPPGIVTASYGGIEVARLVDRKGTCPSAANPK
jgi:hypothetical protein